MAGTLALAVADLEEQEVNRLVSEQLEAGVDPLSLLAECREGMAIVGQRYEQKEYFLSDLIMSGELLKTASKITEPRLSEGHTEEPLGKVVFGTAHGDVHDIGKNIVVTMLSCAGYEVHDLGVDVPPEKFVEKVRETGAPILGMSALMTISFDPMKETVERLKEAGLRDNVKVMVGGGPINEQVRDYVGADYFGKDALEAVELCRKTIAARW